MAENNILHTIKRNHTTGSGRGLDASLVRDLLLSTGLSPEDNLEMLILLQLLKWHLLYW